MAWIETHQSLENHPKTFDLMAAMGWDKDTAIGKLLRFWWWCVDYAEDGDLRKHNDDRLGSAVGVLPGETAARFVEAMVTACWLDRKPYFRVHDWWHYFGKFLQIKYKHNPEKWQRIKGLYDDSRPPPQNPPKNRSKKGSYNHIPNQPNQPIAGQKDPRVRKVIDFFFTRCQEIKKFKPSINGQDAKVVQQTLKRMEQPEIESAIDFFLKSKKADDIGITLAIALSTHSLNSYQQKKKSKAWNEK